MELPRGTVTMVFTDVEGSTRLLHELGTEVYVRALEEHRRLLREAVAARDGVEVEMQGDSFHFAFADAHAAVEAAAEAQRALAEHGWEAEPVRVRVGVHSGEPVVSGRLYAGLDVHRAARVMSAGHGGQVLVSEATRALLGDELPLRDLGEHRLKDLLEPLRLYQLGEQEFPPLKSLYRTNLPVPPTLFLGRERELAELSALLGSGTARLLTLTGPGGTGKTRLAVQAAAEAAELYPDGVFWVGLAPLRDPALVLPTIAQALEARGDPADHIGTKRLLLVLDNLEQLVAAAPELGALLAACPRLALLVTSREPLHLAAEREFPVAPLQEADAIALFHERAGATGIAVSANGEVGEICRRLDQLPLAIELAAARLKTLPPRALLERLEQRLPLLTGGARDLPERQQTLYATIAWSHDLLTAEEQRLFARLAVFAGGCTLEAAEEICDADLDALHALVDKNLLRRADDRYWMLETIREYAAERLDESGEADALRQRHTRHYVALAERTEPELTGPEQAHWLSRLEAEAGNLRTALASSLEQDPQTAARLAGALWRWWLSGRLTEGRRFAEAVLAAPGVEDGLRAKVLRGAAAVARTQGQHGAAESFAEDAVELYRRLDDGRGIADALLALANVAVSTSQLERAESLYEEALALMRELGNVPGISATLTNLGVVARYRGDFERAQAYYEQSLELDRGGDPKGTAITLLDLGHAALAAGDLARALDSFAQSLRLFQRLSELVGIASCLDGLARAEARRHPDRAARLWGAWERILEELGIESTERDAVERADAVAEATRGMGSEAFELAWQDGRLLTVEQAVAYALG